MQTTWKEFLLSMANATLLLAIVLTVSGIILFHEVHSFATDVISDVKVGLLRDMDKDIRLITRSFENSERDLMAIATRLDVITKHPELTLDADTQQNIWQLRAEVASLNKRLSSLTSEREELSDHAIRTLASSFAQTYIDVRNCTVEAHAVIGK